MQKYMMKFELHFILIFAILFTKHEVVSQRSDRIRPPVESSDTSGYL